MPPHSKSRSPIGFQDFPRNEQILLGRGDVGGDVEELETASGDVAEEPDFAVVFAYGEDVQAGGGFSVEGLGLFPAGGLDGYVAIIVETEFLGAFGDVDVTGREVVEEGGEGWRLFVDVLDCGLEDGAEGTVPSAAAFEAVEPGLELDVDLGNGGLAIASGLGGGDVLVQHLAGGVVEGGFVDVAWLIFIRRVSLGLEGDFQLGRLADVENPPAGAPEKPSCGGGVVGLNGRGVEEGDEVFGIGLVLGDDGGEALEVVVEEFTDLGGGVVRLVFLPNGLALHLGMECPWPGFFISRKGFLLVVPGTFVGRAVRVEPGFGEVIEAVCLDNLAVADAPVEGEEFFQPGEEEILVFGLHGGACRWEEGGEVEVGEDVVDASLHIRGFVLRGLDGLFSELEPAGDIGIGQFCALAGVPEVVEGTHFFRAGSESIVEVLVVNG